MPEGRRGDHAVGGRVENEGSGVASAIPAMIMRLATSEISEAEVPFTPGLAAPGISVGSDCYTK